MVDSLTITVFILISKILKRIKKLKNKLNKHKTLKRVRF